MAVTAAAGMAVVLASVAALAAPDERAAGPESHCPPGGYRKECPRPPQRIGAWPLVGLGGDPRGRSHGGPYAPDPYADPPPYEGPHDGRPHEGPYAGPFDGPYDPPFAPPGDQPPEIHDPQAPLDGESGPDEITEERDAPAVPSWRRLRGLIALAAAESMIGTPYSWGGGSAKGPTRGIGHGRDIVGFDCSGLALYAWAQAGVKLAHYTGTQFRQGRRIARHNLRPGDLVFFGPPSGDPNHVGINVGDGVMIHAPQTGDVVKKTSFEKSPHYSSRYRGAVRPDRTR